jgi:ribA/ribD-fused uncharacterized protein
VDRVSLKIVNAKIDMFWGDYYFLSNFFNAEIYLGGRVYASVEHFYQAGKAKTEPLHEYIRNAVTPAEAKIRGREVAKREDWKAVKDEYMKLGLVLKFDITELGDMLLATGDAYLEEGNTWNDTYWGVCDGVGKNTLGILLMEVRDQVIERRIKQVTYVGNA